MNADTHQNINNDLDPKKTAAEQTGSVAADANVNAETYEGKISALQEELVDVKDRYMRNLADMENMRKRHERDRSDLLKYASEKILQDLLPVLDSFEKAVQTVASDSSNGLVEGVRMVHRQLVQILENQGLKAVEAAGKAFDPNVHQAIQRVEADDVQVEIVKDEYQKGYTLNGRLVRPSMVSVFVPKTSGNAEV